VKLVLTSGIVGLVIGPVICAATGERTFFIHITSAFIGAFIAEYQSATSDPFVQIVLSSLGAIVLAVLVNLLLQE
jgi:hypothetical protein